MKELYKKLFFNTFKNNVFYEKFKMFSSQIIIFGFIVENNLN